MKYIKNKKCNPGTIKRYIIENKKINCAFISQNAPYSSIEKAFKRINRLVKNDEFLAIQNGPIKLTKNWKHTSRMVLILRSIINNSELWLCGDTRQTKEKISYDDYCRTLYGKSRRSSSSSYSTI